MDIHMVISSILFQLIVFKARFIAGRGGNLHRNEEGIDVPVSGSQMESRDPVPLGTIRNKYRQMTGVYDDFDLGLFSRYYNEYESFIESDFHQQMQSGLTNDTLVCVNYDVHKDNETKFLGHFICPLPFEPQDYIYCCGAQFADMCCYDTNKFRYHAWVGGITFGSIVVAVLLMGVLCWGVLGQGWCRKSSGRPEEEKEQI